MAGGRRAAAVILGAGAMGLCAWAVVVDRHSATAMGAERAAGEATKTTARLVATILADASAEATAAASVPQFRAALANRVDGATLEDLFATEDWWIPYRDRALTIVGSDGPLAAHPPRHVLPESELITRARAGGSTAGALVARGGPLLVAAVVVDGVRGAPVLTLARPLDAALLARWKQASGNDPAGADGLAVTDGKKTVAASDDNLRAHALGGHEAEAVLPSDGRSVATAKSLGDGLWLWVIRPVTPVAGGSRSWLWAAAGVSGVLAAIVGLGLFGRGRRAGITPPEASRNPNAGDLLASGVRRSGAGANAATLIASGRGQSFGRYALVDRIGEGGMSEIYTATLSGAEGFQRILVIKRLKPELAQNRAAVDQFIDEAKLGSLLVHSNIVQVFDFGKVDDGYYMALEYIVGRTVGQIIERHFERVGAALDLPVVFFIAREVLEALAYAHDRANDDGDPLRIVHRDVSPGNVIVGVGGDVKLIDFGIVKAEDRVSRTDLGNVKGNAAFMAPEQARGLSVDARSDLFSLGLVMYHALTNQLMYEGSTAAETLYKAASGPVAHDLERVAALPQPAARVLLRALAPDPAHRYQSADEFADDLAAEVQPTAKAAVAILMNALFGPELRPQSGGGGSLPSMRGSGIGRRRTG